MLVLSRLREEAVIISCGGERIRVAVVDIRGDKARLGFEADPRITINREEIQDQIDKQGESDGRQQRPA